MSCLLHVNSPLLTVVIDNVSPLLSVHSHVHGRDHCYYTISFVTFLGWRGGGQTSKPNPVIREHAWKRPLLEQIGAERVPGSQQL